MTPLGLARKIVQLPERGVVTAEFERLHQVAVSKT
jgi:hypothetical protein